MDLPANEVICRYNNGESTNSLANLFHTTHHTVKRLLVKHGIKLRNKQESHRSTFKYTPTGELYNEKPVFVTPSGRLCVINDYKWGRGTATILRAKCDNCGKDYLCGRNEAKKRACSDKCRVAVISGPNNYNWTGGIKNRRGHVQVYSPDHPCAKKKYCYEHRLVMEQAIGRLLRDDEFVHHINGVKSDNRFENLFLCSNSQHTIAHNSLIPLLKSLLDRGTLTFNVDIGKYELKES